MSAAPMVFAQAPVYEQAMPTAMAMPTYGQVMPAYEQAYGFPQAVQTAPVMGLQQYGTQQFAYAAAPAYEPIIETIPAVTYAPQYAAAPMVEYAAAPQYAAAPMVEYMAAPVMEYAAAPAYTYAEAAPAYNFATVPAVQTFAQAPAVYDVAPQYMTAAAPTVNFAPAPSYQPVTYAAAPAMMEAPVTYAAMPPAVEYQPMVETMAAPMAMTYAAPSYTPAPALATQGSYYMTPGNLQQSASMIAYPGFQGAGGPFNFVANPTAVAQPQVLTQNQQAERALEAKIMEQQVVNPDAPKKKKVTKKTKKGCC